MKFEQVLDITKKAVAQTMGNEFMNESGLLNATESFKIADVGESITSSESTVERFTSALVSLCAKTVITSKEYKRRIKSLHVDNFEWGGFVQRVYVDLSTIVDDPMVNLTNGMDYSSIENKYYKPTAKAKIFKEAKSIMCPISITRDLLKEAFRSWDELNAYLTKIRMQVQNTINLALYAYEKMLVSCGIAKSVSENGLNNAVHLVTLAKEKGIVPSTVTTYNDIVSSGELTHRRFLTFVCETISNIRSNMLDLSTAYNNGDYPTFCESELLLISQFAKQIRFNARANTFNSNELSFGDYEEINSWQGIRETSKDAFDFDTVTKVMIASDSNNKLGIGTDAFTQGGVIGLCFDRMAMGICLERIKMTSNYTACADFWNEFTHILVNYLLDDNFNIVAFVLD